MCSSYNWKSRAAGYAQKYNSAKRGSGQRCGTRTSKRRLHSHPTVSLRFKLAGHFDGIYRGKEYPKYKFDSLFGSR